MSSYYYYRSNRAPQPSKPPRKPPAFRLRIPKFIVLAGCLVGLAILSQTVFASSKPPSQTNQAAQKQIDQPKATVDTSKLQAQLDGIIQQYPYDTGISIVELNSGKLIQSGDNHAFLAASTTKILTALAFLQGVEKGHYQLNQTIAGKSAQQQLQSMINQSDNPAWKTMNDTVGRDNLQVFAQKNGLASYNAVDNTITSDDMARLLAKFYQRQLLSEQNTKLLLGWMQNTNEERFIPSSISGDIKVYHKAGYLAERAHDVAIIDNGATPFALVIYSKTYSGDYDFVLGQKLFKQATAATLTTFQTPKYN